MTDLLSELEALTDKFRHDPFVSGEEQVEIAHRIDAIKAEIAAAVRDAAMWRMVTSEHSVCGDETAKCHVIVGVNMWRGDEWLSFQQCTPEQLQKALKHDTAMRAGEGEG